MKILTNVLKVCTFPLRLVCYLLIYMYKCVVAPILPHTCCYYPTCSNYMLGCIREFGVVKGVQLGIKRICRCNPKAEGGIDYVPLNIKGDNKWIF